MQCEACSSSNAAGQKFCGNCGQRLPSDCPACGSQNPPSQKFCGECGAALIARAPAPQAERPPHEVADRQLPYTPKHLADKILRSRSALEGERKQVTVMFADVKGSMELADQVGAEAWHVILDRFFQILSEGVHRFEGTVNQYTGDGVMALFGAPISHEDHAQRACFASLWLKDELRNYADELRRTQELSFSVRIGLNSGEVVVGRIGDDLRMDYTAQGLTVGLAQRMEQLAAADTAYLTGHTARHVEGFFALRDLGEFNLKGVADPLPVFELEGTGTLRTRLDLSRARGFSRFVGRSEEVHSLDSALQRAVEGQGGVVGVVADAGVGKSRLCLEFTERCRAQGISVFSAHCPSHGKLIPLLPVYELVRDIFGIAENDSPQATREKVAGRMLLLDRDFEELLPLAFDFLGVPDPARPLDIVNPGLKQRALQTMLRRLVQARSARELAVLLVDDVHWIDSGSDEHLAAIAEIVAQTRTVLLLNFRPEYSAPWMSDSSYQQLPLRPLGDEAINDLLDHLLGDDASTAPLRPTVRQRSAGNPFFIEEIVQSLVESGRLVGERGAYQLRGSPNELVVPDSVQAILSARIDRLAAREKTVLQTAAAIGRRFGDPLLREVCDLSASDFDEAIATLRRGELIHEESLYPELEYAFRHPLTHEVAQRSQLAPPRREIHARIAGALERIHAEHLDENAALLSHHWDEASQTEPAARWHRRAAEWIAGGNPNEAKRHWERVRELSGEIDDSELALELGQQSRLMLLEYGWRVGMAPEEAVALLEEGESWARANDDRRALAAIYNAFAIPCAFLLGDFWRAKELSEEGLRLAEEVGDEALAFALELRIFFCADPIGIVADTQAAIEAAMQRPRTVMDATESLVGYDARAAAVGFRAWPRSFAGNLREGLECAQEGLAIAREREAIEVVGWMLFVEADIRTLLGESASAAARESYEIAEAIDSDMSRVVSGKCLAAALIAEGEPAAAAAVLERIEPLAASAKQVEADVLIQVAIARCGLGDLAGARVAAERALAQSLERRLFRAEALARMALAQVNLEEEGDAHLHGSRTLLDEAEAQLNRLGHRVALPRLSELRARLAEREADPEARQAALLAATALYQEMDAPRQVERIREML